MAIIKGEIPEELDEEFRKIIALKYGLKKGNISLALKNAIEQWVNDQKRSTNDNNTEKKDFANKIRAKHPNQFVAVNTNNEIVGFADTIIGLHKKLDSEKNIRIIAPSDIIGEQDYSRRQLGWKLKRREG